MVDGSSVGWGSKSEFVRRAPLTWGAARVVEEARRVGLQMGEQLVWNVRSRYGLRFQAPHGTATRKRRPTARAAAPSAAAGAGAPAEFLRIVAELGTLRAEALLGECRRRFAAVA
jgi:hypothetical protein